MNWKGEKSSVSAQRKSASAVLGEVRIPGMRTKRQHEAASKTRLAARNERTGTLEG